MMKDYAFTPGQPDYKSPSGTIRIEGPGFAIWLEPRAGWRGLRCDAVFEFSSRIRFRTALRPPRN